MAATMTRSTAWPSSSTGRRSVLPLTAPKPPYKACTLCGEIPSGDDGQSAPLRWATGSTFFGPAREMRTESNKATPGPVSTLKLYTRLSFSPAIGRTLSGTDGFSPRLRPQKARLHPKRRRALLHQILSCRTQLTAGWISNSEIESRSTGRSTSCRPLIARTMAVVTSLGLHDADDVLRA